MKNFLFLILLLLPAGIFAQAYQLNLQGTRQIGKASTGLAQPTDATSLFTNPGSAVFLEENDVTFGITPAISKGKFTDATTNAEAESDNPVETPFNLSAVFGNSEGNWRFGLSVYTPFGSTMQWEQDSPLRFETTKMSLLSISVQPTVSYKITDKLGIGAGFIYTYGNVDMRRDLPVQHQDGSFGNTAIKADANGFGVNAGLYFKASDQVDLAFTYRSGLKMKTTSGTAEFDVPTSLQENFPTQDIKAELPLPQIFGLGLSYKPTEEWVVNAEAYLSDWSDYDVIKVNYEESPVNGEDATKLVREYGNGYSFRVGVEYLPSGKDYELRAGVMHNRSPIPDDLVNPDVPDADRFNPSIGASYKFSEKFRADASLLMEFIQRSKNKNKITGIEGTYNFDLFLPSVGLSYKF